MKFLLIEFDRQKLVPSIKNICEIEAEKYSNLQQVIADTVNEGETMLMDNYGVIAINDKDYGLQWANTSDQRFGVIQFHSLSEKVL